MKQERKDKIIAYTIIFAALIIAYNLGFGESGEYIRELIKHTLKGLF